MIGDGLRQRLSEMKQEMPVQRASRLRGADLPRLAELAVRFAIAFVLSGSQIFGAASPFAVAFIAAATSAAGGIVSLLGAVLGYLITGPIFWSIPYISVAVIVTTAIVVFRDTQVFRSSWFMPVGAAFIMACIGFVPILRSGWNLPDAALMATDVVLAGGCAYFYKIALSPWSGRLNLEHGSEITHTVSILILLSTLLISLAQLKIFGLVSVGRTAATLIVFLAAYKGGVGMGCATGISIGLAMDAAMSTGAGAAPIFCTAYGLAGLISGIFSKQSRFVFALVYILVDAVIAAVSIGNADVPAILYEVFIASVVFMVLPGSLMARLSVLLPSAGSGYGLIKAREYTRKRVELTSQAFRDLFETVRSASGHDKNDGDVAAVFDKAADIVCLNCSKTAKCWHQDYQSTVDAMNNASAAMLKRGHLEQHDLPEHFRKNCTNMPDFLEAVNAELKSLMYRRQYKKRLKENQSAAFNQYADVSAILQGISEELGAGTSFEPELETRLRKYLRSQNIQAESAVFRDRSGRLHAEIFGGGIASFKKEPDYLEKLSAVFNVRLCTVDHNDEIGFGSAEPDRLFLLEAEPLAAAVGIACRKKNEQEPSGDRGAYFKTDEGLLYVLLSDGMGSGDQAAKYSSDAVRILERFLRAGVAPETAVRMLNDLMLLKNEDDTGCVTVDLVSLNLFTGAARMFKYGAAPSYLRSGSTVRRIKGRSMAAGLGVPPHDAPDLLKMELKAGSLAVIVSDGITGGMDDGWLCEMLSAYEGDNPRELAGAIIKTASEKLGNEDDMTVISIAVTERQ
jgi:stage II sporulation protein E